MANPNIYEGDKRRIVPITVNVVIPDGLQGDEMNDYIDSLYSTIQNTGNFWYDFFGHTKSKYISVRDVLVHGWEYVTSGVDDDGE